MPQKRLITFTLSAVKELEEIKAWYIDQQVYEQTTMTTPKKDRPSILS
jgi:hypothetical protein